MAKTGFFTHSSLCTGQKNKLMTTARWRQIISRCISSI